MIVRQPRAGTLTTTTLAIVVGCGVATVGLGHASEIAVTAALSAVALAVVLCLVPLGLVDRTVEVTPAFAGLMLAVGTAIGAFALALPASAVVATILVVVAVALTAGAFAALAQMRRRPGWKRAPGGPIGFYAEGPRDEGRR